MSYYYAHCQVLNENNRKIQIMPKSPKYQLEPLEQKLTIGERIAKIRRQQGLTQKALAKKLGVERYLISDYERGRIRLYDEMVTRFALALGVDTDEILGLKTEATLQKVPSLRLIKRITRIENLPHSKQKSLLQIIDGFLKGEGK